MIDIGRLILFIFLVCSLKMYSQKVVDIDFFINNIENSDQYKIITNQNKINIIQNDFFRKSLLPKVNLDFTLPYQRSISDVTQPDGTIKFIERNFLNSAAVLNLSQVLPFTGGTINLSNSLNYSRDFNNNYTNFSSNWINLSYQQPINGYNAYKWNKKINTFDKRKDSIEYIKNKIRLKYDISKSYIDVENSQLKSYLLRENIDRIKIVLNEINERYKYGRAIKTEVEQVELTLEQLKNYSKSNDTEYQNLLDQLKRKSNLTVHDSIILKSVEDVEFTIVKEEVIQKMEENGFNIEWAINELKAEANLEKIRKQGAISISLQAGIGVNSSADEISNLFNTPRQTQFISFGVKIPVLNWGISKDNTQIALIEKENVKFALKEERSKRMQVIEELINYYSSLKSQIQSLRKQLDLSDKLLKNNKELLFIGRKTVSEYKNQIYENIDLSVEYKKLKSNYYLLKLKVDELNLIF